MFLNTVCATMFALTAQTVTPAAPPAARPADAPAIVESTDGLPSDSGDQPVTHFFQNLGHDIAALASARTATLLLVGGGAALFIHPLDENIHNWVVKQPTTPELASFGNGAGGVWAQDAGALALWGIGAATGHAKVAHIGADLIRAQALVTILVVPTKMIVNRDRPNGGTRAFPSGHASATFATAAVLESHFGWKAGVPGYALASLVGWARMRSDNHWFSDVVFGASMGLIAGKTVAAGHRQAWTIVPARTTGGMAVYLVRTGR